VGFDFSYPGTRATELGWGPMWPVDRGDEMVPLVVNGKDLPQGVQPGLLHLLTSILEEVEAGGYELIVPGCHGFAGRYTKRSDGTTTDMPGKSGQAPTVTPSNHSAGTAVDVNAPTNVFGGGHDMPQWVADLFRKYGFRWLGPPIQDWMHFDFAGTPDDAERMTLQAREDGIGMALTKEQAETLEDAKRFLDALRAGIGSIEDVTKPALPAGAGNRVAAAVRKAERE
jgi:hypothetical protein